MIANILSRNAQPKYTDPLIKLVRDPVIDVAREAATGLGKIADAKARGPLLEALNKLYGFTPEQAESQMDSSAISAGSAVNGRGGGSWQ